MSKNNSHVVLLGDCLEILKNIPSNSIDSLVTDPPAGVSILNKGWDSNKGGRDKWIEWMYRIALECLRIIKPGGYGLVWSLPRTSHWTMLAFENAGWEIRDKIAHVFGQGFPKNDAALKPAREDWILVKKPISEINISENIKKWGTGYLNIDACLIKAEKITGWGGRAGFTNWDSGLKKNGNPRPTLGRYPANIIHDNSQDVLDLFPYDPPGTIVKNRTDGMRPFNNDGKKTNYKKEAEIKDPGGSKARYFYGECNYDEEDLAASRIIFAQKITPLDRDEGLEELQDRMPTHGRGHQKGGLQVSNSKRPKKNHHETVKPTGLMRYLCRLITPPGGTILDPFAGSGSTGKAAVIENFGFIGIELDEDYFKIAELRIRHAERVMCSRENIIKQETFLP